MSQSTIRRDSNAGLTGKEILKFQEMIERVGKRETSGFIFLMEEIPGKKDVYDGLVFSENMSLLDVHNSLLVGCFKTMEQRIEFLSDAVKFTIDKADQHD